MKNQTKQKKIYRDENGVIYTFNLAKFKSIIKSNARTQNLKNEEYERSIAEKLSCSYETFLGWKKGKNSPQDINLIHDIEDALDLSLNALLFSKEKQLESELDKTKNQNAELLLENKSLKRQMKDNKNSNIHSSNISIIEMSDWFGLKYDGFSNLIDILIGKYCGEDIDENISSSYAEDLFYVLNEYIYRYSFTEIIGYKVKRTAEEVNTHFSEYRDISNEDFIKWVNDAVVNEKGEHLYDKEGRIALHGLGLWEKLIKGKVFNPDDANRVSSLLEELIARWDRIVFPYAAISVIIQHNGVVVDKYTFGEGLVSPTNDDRMDIVLSLLLLNNGDISKFALQNATKIEVDEFEMEISLVYDLDRLI